MFTIPDSNGSNVIRGVVSFNPPVTESEHIIDKEGIGKVVNTDGGVLLAKMSFQMTADVFDKTWFHLVEDSENSPTTGIKINIDGTKYYEKQSTFRFTDEIASKDADLSQLVLSSEKEYELTPKFDKDTLKYELTLLEYIDTMNIKAIQSDAKSTMKIKIPKRDADNHLMYESDGTTIIYEEKDLQNGMPLEFVLNHLGEPDTKITVKVTAEDGKTTKEYEVVIKRPCGTIKGKIFTEPTKKTTGTYNAQIYAYSVADTAKRIDWDAAVQATAMLRTDSVNSDLHTIVEKAKEDTNDDGTFEMILVPGNYDILIDKSGYLDRIFVNVKMSEDQVVDLVELNAEAPDNNENNLTTLNEFITLFAGDSNKNGVVEILDSTLLELKIDTVFTDDSFSENCDFNNNKSIGILDSTVLEANTDKTRKILKYSN